MKRLSKLWSAILQAADAPGLPEAVRALSWTCLAKH